MDILSQTEDVPYVCFRCMDGKCGLCVDVMAVIYDEPTECKCTRPNHAGEPTSQQIKDPETGAVHAPGLVVEESGEVKRNDGTNGIDP